jgi:plastocyanin
MSKKQIITLIITFVLVVAIIVFGLTNREPKKEKSVPVSSPTGESNVPPVVGYTPEIPDNAVLTPPKNEAPASANPKLDTKIRFFDLKATKKGFEPASFTVNKGDGVRFDFTAVDGDYDLNFPYLGAYFSVVKKGETRSLPIDTSLAGTFAFECRDFCPASGKIQGQLIVLP